MSIIHNKESGIFMIDCDYQINKVDLEMTEKPHTHDFVELVYTTGGKGIHNIDGKEYHVKRGDMLVINYNCLHEVSPVEKLSYIDIMLKLEYFEKSLGDTDDVFLLLGLRDFSDLRDTVIKDNILLHFDGEERKRTETLLDWTWEEQTDTRAASALVKKSALSMILSIVFRKMTQNCDLRPSVNDSLLSYIRRNCTEKLQIKDLASACGYSTEHFSRLFKNYTGISPTVFVSECRLEHAKKLILTTDKRIDNIIAECGFSDRTAFFGKFSKRYGISPLKLRRNQN